MRCLFFLVILFPAVPLLTSFAQDNTKVGLPEGAIARLGKGGIVAMRFSPDGTRLAIGTEIGAWVYDVNTGAGTILLPTALRHANNRAFGPSRPAEWQPASVAIINHLAFSPDNHILAVSESSNWIVQLWNIETHRELSMFPLTTRRDSVSAITFSQDGKTLITPNYFGDIIHWDTVSGSQTIHLKRYRPDLTLLEEDGKYGSHSIDELAFVQDGMTFVSGDPKDGKIRLWDAATGRQLAIFKAKSPFAKLSQTEPEIQKGVNALAFSPDGKTVASAHDDNTVRLWDPLTSTETATLKGHKERINTLAFSPDSALLASGSADDSIILWNVRERRKHATLTGHRDEIGVLTFSPVGRRLLASGSVDGTVRFWNADAGSELSTFTTGHTAWIGGVAFSADDTTLASVTGNGTVQIWDIKTGHALTVPPIARHDKSEAAAFSSDATLFASHGADSTVRSRGANTRTSWRPHAEIRLWNLRTGVELATLSQQAGALAFSPDNIILAASDPEKTLLWDVRTGLEISRFNAKQFSMNVVVTFSPDGTILATGGMRGETHLWRVNTGHKLATLTATVAEFPKVLAFSPDNSTLAVGYVNNHIRLWDLKTKQERNTRLAVQQKIWVEILKFSPDEKILLMTTHDFKMPREIQLWDMETDQALPSIRTGHTARIQTLKFSHDGKTLASGAADGTILLWDWDKIIAKQTPNNKGN